MPLLMGFWAVASVAGVTEVQCRHERSTAMTWSYGGIFRGPGLYPGSAEGGDELLTFLLTERQGILKGNMSTTVLVRLHDYFLEPTAGNNVTIWRYLPATEGISPYMIQLIAAPLADAPYSMISAWRCRAVER